MKTRLSRRCRVALGALALEPGDENDNARHAAHRRGCAACAESDAALSRVNAAVLQPAEALDDLARARILGNLEPVIDDVARELSARAVPQPTSRTRKALLAVATVVGLVIGVTVTLIVLDQTAEQPISTTDSGGQRALIHPYRVEAVGQDWPAGQAMVGNNVKHIRVPAGVVVRARLGRRTDLAVFGPAELSVARSRAGIVRVNLGVGTLVASYHQRSGTRANTRLEIHAAGVVTRVVGTVFLVRATPDQRVEVAVAQGKVRVRHENQTTMVQQHQSWNADSNVLPLVARHAALFARFAAGPGSGQTNERAEGAGASPRLESRTPVNDSVIPKPTPDAPEKPASRPRITLGEPRQLKHRAEETVANTKERPSNEVKPSPPPQDSVSTDAASNRSAALPVSQERTPKADAGADVELYHRAEQAMRTRSWPVARRLLRQLTRLHPGCPLAAQARYELARLAFRAHEYREADQQLVDLLASGADARLVEPAAFFRCRIAERRGRHLHTVRCLERFRALYPRSPHDEAALIRIIRLAGDDCARLQRSVAKYIARYAGGRFSSEAEARRKACMSGQKSRPQ